jgi:anaerobic selenocysteine-containing dehydrogenase
MATLASSVAASAAAPVAHGATRTRRTTCYQCTTECGFTATIDENDRVVEMAGPDCRRGATQIDLQYHEDRLLHPLRRTPTGLERASWDDALDEIATRLNDLKVRYGPESVAFVAGYTKEARPYLQRLAHAFGSPNFMTESSCCFSATSVAGTLNYGKDFAYFLGGSRVDSPKTRTLVVWSTNPVESSVLGERHFAMRDRDDRALVVVDPRRTPVAERADVHLQIRPGTDGALALGLHHLMFENGWEDGAFLAEWSQGLPAFREYVRAFTPERVAEICGVSPDDIREAARLYGTQGPAQLLVSANATVHHSNGLQNHRAILLLPAVTGNLEIDGGNRRFVARTHLKPVTLFDTIGDLPPRLGEERFPVWASHYPQAHAMPLADAILEGRPYPIKAVVAVGMNVNMWPNSPRLAKALASLDTFVAAEFFHTPTTTLADWVLPAATSLERAALIAPGNGRVVYRQAVVPPEGEARSDAQMLVDLGCRLGMADQFWNGDLRASVEERLEGIPGLTLEDLIAEPTGITVPGGDIHPEREYERRGFQTPSGKVEFESDELRRHGYSALPVYEEPVESPISTPKMAEQYDLVLTSGGRSRNFTHSQHRNVSWVRALEPNPRIQIHPDDAAARGITDTDTVFVSSPRGEVEFQAWVTDVVAPGVVHAFHGWAEANINILTNDETLDPISGFPAFKSSLCQVRGI